MLDRDPIWEPDFPSLLLLMLSTAILNRDAKATNAHVDGLRLYLNLVSRSCDHNITAKSIGEQLEWEVIKFLPLSLYSVGHSELWKPFIRYSLGEYVRSELPSGDLDGYEASIIYYFIHMTAQFARVRIPCTQQLF
jgi:hypothetical protein